MAEKIVREIVSAVVKVLSAQELTFGARRLVDESTGALLNTLQRPVLIRRVRKLLDHMTPAKILKLYAAGKLSGDYDVLRIVSVMINSSSLANTRDAAILRDEVAEHGKS